MKKFLLTLCLILSFSAVLKTGTVNEIWQPTLAVGVESQVIKPIAQRGLVPIPLSQHLAQPLLDPQELECMSKNIYFEAAVESTAGKIAVAQVTMNRVRSSRFPDTICKVVYEGRHHASGHPKRDMCQFSWYCDGKHDNPNESLAWRKSQEVAEYVIRTPSLIDITDGATHYHADYINPPRSARLNERTLQIDTHIFYNKKNNFNF